MIIFRPVFLLKIIRYFVLMSITAAVFNGCGPEKYIPVPTDLPPDAYQIDGKTYYPIKTNDAFGFRQQGVASWYGKKFHEKKTANGEIYNMFAMTAAHKTLPFGTMVEVRNLENNKTTLVRINDRGPFVNDRIIDLSHSAANEIGMIQNGTASVEIIVLGTDDDILAATDTDASANPYFTGDFTIQVGSFSNKANAEQLKSKIEGPSTKVFISPFDKNGTTFYRVRVGRYTSLKQAKVMERQLIENGYNSVYTMAWDL
jgi:rare lipoprotein A